MTIAKQTAHDLYVERRGEIARILDWIELELDKHQIKAKTNPTNWGYSGDLGYVREKLIQTLAFLANFEPHEIEDLLSECR